ncbi:MAG TPA: hypothetical protein VMR49_00775 [Candidatus Paceibacterota bacterium]|nr:hypothetical protein [Candidatus Paceibacterota bacterium]
MNDAKILASGAQYARLGLTISNGVIDAVDGHFTVNEMQEILKNETLIRNCTSKIVSELLAVPIDPWADQKKKIERFYKSIFNLTIDWSAVPLPTKVEGFDFLEYMAIKLTEDDIFNAYAKKFGKDAVWKYYDNIHKAIKEQQSRPNKNYIFCHRGGIEPDVEHLNKSYDDFYQDGNSYMVPKEGLLSAFRYRFETGNMWDIKGVTRFHALDSDGRALYMSRDGFGRFCVGYGNRDYRNGALGPRQISF